MLPYFPQPVFTFGPVHMYAFGLLALAAVLVGRGVFVRRARRFGMGYEEVAPLYLLALVAGIAGAVAEALLTTGHGLASHGALMGAAVAGCGYCRVRKLPWRRGALLLDIAAFAAPFAAATGRLGCTLAHEHRGLASSSWLAFRFPEGSRYDLGFLDMLFLVALCFLFLALDRKPRPPLFFLGTGACAYGAFRLWRRTLEVSPEWVPWAAVGAIGIAALVFGTAILRRHAGQEGQYEISFERGAAGRL